MNVLIPRNHLRLITLNTLKGNTTRARRLLAGYLLRQVVADHLGVHPSAVHLQHVFQGLGPLLVQGKATPLDRQTLDSLIGEAEQRFQEPCRLVAYDPAQA